MDAIRYAYEDIDQVVAYLKQVAQDIMDEANRLRSSVESSMSDWTGDTADMYRALSDDLVADLQNNKEWLNHAATILKERANAMYEQDHAGARNMPGA